MSNKPISFKPTHIDQLLIDAIKKSGYKTNADVIRAGIQQLAIISLDPDEYLNLVATGYENDVVHSPLHDVSKNL